MIWRRLIARSECIIANIRCTAQIAIGWSDDHLNQFHIPGQDCGDCGDAGISFTDKSEEVFLSVFGFRVRECLLFEYDFDDAWLDEIRI